MGNAQRTRWTREGGEGDRGKSQLRESDRLSGAPRSGEPGIQEHGPKMAWFCRWMRARHRPCSWLPGSLAALGPRNDAPVSRAQTASPSARQRYEAGQWPLTLRVHRVSIASFAVAKEHRGVRNERRRERPDPPADVRPAGDG